MGDAGASDPGHWPAELRGRADGGGWDTFCGCGADWPCPRYVPAPVASGVWPLQKAGAPCLNCGEITGAIMREHEGRLVCPDCDESWLNLPAPSMCRVLWEDDELYLNEEWVGSIGREGEAGDHAPYDTWLRGRGWAGTRHDDHSAAMAALIERAAREIAAHASGGRDA